ncbi:MAG TPA: hypothetical protein VGO58_14600 [Chitinophagaceae bacterium]|jgi:hypothetical protein|nr:hypothetical protein [Chitinophagaceae bacterium]
MKRILFLLTMSLPAFLVNAQKYDEIKTKLTLSKYTDAKADVDKAMTNAKFTSKPEAYLLKASIYAAISMDEDKKGKATGDQLATEADVAFKKYKEMEPGMELMEDLIYKNGPTNIYYNYYTSGYADYDTANKLEKKKKLAKGEELAAVTELTNKKWLTSYEKFKKASEYADLLISKKIFEIPLDTNVLILAGVTAENSNNKDQAVKYYGRLADSKISGEGFESIYRYLVSYYFGKKDMTNFDKYKALGKQLYPKSDYFNFDKVDFAVGLQEKLDDKIKAVEEVLVTDPANFKANEVLGEIIFDALNPKEEGALPANAADLEKKMIGGFNKAAAAKAGYEIPYLYLGDHFINKAVKVNKEREDHAAEMKARTKPGTMASKEDIAKRDALDKKYSTELEQAQEPYEKAVAIFQTKGTLEMRDKQQYKKAVSYLADISANKKVQAKGKPADQAKYAAEEKKWNDLWETIK